MARLISLVLAFLLTLSAAFAQQTDRPPGSKLPDLPPVSFPLSGNELLYIVQQGASKKTTLSSVGAGPGGAATSLGTLQVSPTDTRFGALCDGTTDDSAAFIAALAFSNLVIMPAGKICVAGNVVVDNNQTLDCNGGFLKPPVGALWGLKQTGFNSHVKGCGPYDPNFNLMRTTTTNGTVAPGATVIPVASTTGFQVQMIVTIQLVSGAYWTSYITVVGPSSITIADAVPSTIAAAPTINAGGSAYLDGECVVQGGNGPPMTGTITTSGGAITGFTTNAPGLYTSAPASPATVFCPATAAAFGGALNVTWDGVASGATVDAAFGALLIDKAINAFTEDVTIPEAAVGVQIMNSTGSSTETSIRGLSVNAAPMVGLAKLASVNNYNIREATVNGFTHHASAFGVTGLYTNGDNQAGPSGGNSWDIITLGFETGGLYTNSTLELSEKTIFDTSRNYGLACMGCSNGSFINLWGTFTGPSALSGVGGKGLGVYFGNSALSDTVSSLTTQGNAIDVHFGDQTSSVWINGLGWGTSKVMSGFTNSLYPGQKLFSVPTISVAGLASPRYIVPGAVSATQTISDMTGLRGDITTFWASASISPGSATYQVFLYVNRFDSIHTASATVQAGGAGGTNGACTVTVVGGTGNATTLSGTVTANALAGALTVLYAGFYSVPPAANPVAVTGCGLTGATVNLTMTNYDGWNAYGSCLWTGQTQGCLYAGPAIPIFPEDQVEFGFAIQGGGTFPANLTFSGFVDGV